MPHKKGVERRARICELASTGMNNTQIANEIGVSRERVRQLVADMGLAPGPERRRRRIDAILPRLLTLMQEGKTTGEASRSCGIRAAAEDEAEAKLRAINAELLEALTDALEYVAHESSPWRPWHDRARTAIAKATGG